MICVLPKDGDLINWTYWYCKHVGTQIGVCERAWICSFVSFSFPTGLQSDTDKQAKQTICVSTCTMAGNRNWKDKKKKLKKTGQKNCFWSLLGFTVHEGCGTDTCSRGEKLSFSSGDQGGLIWSHWNDSYPALPSSQQGRILSDW